MTAASAERAALVVTLRDVGPDAPTLCEGWLTRDLVAHLIVREGRPDASPGIFVKPLARYSEKVQNKVAQRDWDDLLHTLASGPPLYSPLKALDRLVNLAEMFVHHEDVLRAQQVWEPRELSDDVSIGLAGTVPRIAKLMLGNMPNRVRLVDEVGQVLATGGTNTGIVTVAGAPGELLLWLFGRDEAQVELRGEATSVAAVRATERRI